VRVRGSAPHSGQRRYKQLYRIRRRLADQMRDGAEAEADVVTACAGMANAYTALGDPWAALRRYKLALRLAEKVAGADGDKSASLSAAGAAGAAEKANRTAGTLYNMSFALEQLGQIGRARAALRDAVTAMEKGPKASADAERGQGVRLQLIKDRLALLAPQP
jgi:hypothetical protein